MIISKIVYVQAVFILFIFMKNILHFFNIFNASHFSESLHISKNTLARHQTFNIIITDELMTFISNWCTNRFLRKIYDEFFFYLFYLPSQDSFSSHRLCNYISHFQPFDTLWLDIPWAFPYSDKVWCPHSDSGILL